MARRIARALRLLVLVPLLGCAEATRVQSMPAGAAVYAGDRLVGLTPTVYHVPRSEWRDEFVLRLERDGYDTAQVTVPTVIGKGRIVGGIFTLGIVWLFKRPTTLPDRVDVLLVPRLPPPVAAPAPATEDRLRALQRLLDQGLITEPEYRQRRADILNQL